MRGRLEMWAKDLGVVVEKSSAFNPISNGTAKRHVQVAKRMLDIGREEKVPVEEAMARFRASPSQSMVSAPRGCSLGESSGIHSSQPSPTGRMRNSSESNARSPRTRRESRGTPRWRMSLQRYVPKVGDLVLLQNQRTKRWDCPATVHLVRPGSRSAYVVAEDDGQMYLQSHIYLRLRQAEESANDAVPDPESDTVSNDTDDPALSHQTLAQASLARTQAVGNISIVRSNQRKLPPKNLMAQLTLSCTEEVGQSSTEAAPRKKVRFFLPCEHTDSRSNKRDVTCGGYPTEASLPFDCCCRKSTSAHAFCLPTN